MTKRNVRSRQNSQDPEEMLGASMFMKVVGSIILALCLWMGSQVYQISSGQNAFKVQIDSQGTSLSNINNKVESLMNNQYSKVDALRDAGVIENRIKELESRIRALENFMNASGSSKDPMFVNWQSVKDEIVNLKANILSLSQDLKNISKFQETKEKP